VALVNAKELVALSRVRVLAESGEAAAIRRRAGLSLSEVAGSLGVSPVTVHRWERSTRRPRGRAALRYAALLESLGVDGDTG
jgi:DNA-binding transcriptional regulator YiaG